MASRLPLSMAGLPGSNPCVHVGPPLSCNGPSFGSELRMSPLEFSRPPGPVLRHHPPHHCSGCNLTR
jgi:hypothetical protein